MIINLVSALINSFIKFIWMYSPKQYEIKQLLINEDDLKETKNLSSILKAKTINETLSNILEWQEQNIEYWFERAESTTLIHITTFAILLLLYVLGAVSTPIFFVIVVILITIFIVYYILYPNKMLLSLILIFYIGLFLYQFTEHGINIPYFYIGFGFLIGIIIGVLIEKIMIYKHLTKKNSFSSKIPDILGMLKLTFEIRLPISKLLDYKSAICRDYATLSAALLVNSNIEPYYVVIPMHVAVAAKINNDFYVIDQRLPIRQLDKWLSYNNESDCRIYKINCEGNEEKLNVQFVQKYSINKDKISRLLDREILEQDINRYFSVTKSNRNTSFKVLIDRKAIEFYDEVTHLSVVRMIIKEIEKQFCNNVNQISRVEIKEENEGLIADVYY